MRDFITQASSYAGVPEYLMFNDNEEEGLLTGQDQLQILKDELFYNLKKKIMKVGKQKKGDKISLNPQALKDLYKLIMLQLTKSERSAIAIYELQTFVIEQTVKPKEVWDGMNFEQFFTFIMALIRIEPNLWIKSSEQYHTITTLLKQQFGENMGGIPMNNHSDEQIQHANEQRIDKQNENAIANYRHYIEYQKLLKARENGVDTKSESNNVASSSIREEKKEDEIEGPVEEVEGEELKSEDSDNDAQVFEKMKERSLKRKAEQLKSDFKLHCVSNKRKGQVLDIKLLPLLYRFYLDKIEQSNLKITTSQQFLLQNFIMFLSFKEKKNKRKRMTQYSLLAMGQDFDEDHDVAKEGHLRRSTRTKQQYEIDQASNEEKKEKYYHSDTSLSSIINDDIEYNISRQRETNSKYNLRKRPLFSVRFDEQDPHDSSLGVGNTGGANTRLSAIKRRKVRDQEEIVKTKDEIINFIQECKHFEEFCQFIGEGKDELDEILQSQNDVATEQVKFCLSEKAILCNIINVLDGYVKIQGWSYVVPEHYTLEQLAEKLQRLRKTIISDDDEIIQLISAYIFNYQNRLLIHQKGKTALKKMAKIMNKSNQNAKMSQHHNFNPDTLWMQGTPWPQGEVNAALERFRVQQLSSDDEEEEKGLHQMGSKENADDPNDELIMTQNQRKRQFVKKWSESDYKKFFDAVEMFKDSQLGNKKIAKYMGDHIDPMQIRYEKIKYQKNKRKVEREHQQKKIYEAQSTMHEADWVLTHHDKNGHQQPAESNHTSPQKGRQ